MPITPPPTNPQPAVISVKDIITDAFVEAGWLAPGETVDADNLNYGFRRLNRLIHRWAAAKAYVWAAAFQLFSIPPNKLPVTIGPDGDLYMFQRPIRIESAAFILNSGSQAVDVPIKLVGKEWWAAQTVKALVSSIETYLYYQADVPNGSLFFWPTVNAQAQVRLETWAAVQEFSSFDQPVLLPQGYDDALVLTLAAALDGPRYAQVAEEARQARLVISNNNNPPPPIDTSGGMPGSSGDNWRFNFLTREPYR